MKKKDSFLKGKQILPPLITGKTTVPEIIDQIFLAYNSARLREACRLFTRKMLEPDVTVGLSLTGALTPAGVGRSSIIPLIENGFIDWIVTTGANLYHDSHFAIGHTLHIGSPFLDDTLLRREGVVRIYDILFDYKVLLSTDSFFRETIQAEEFQKSMSSAEFHYLLGKYVKSRETALGLDRVSLLSAAYDAALPIYTPSPGDSSIGMNIARGALDDSRTSIDVARDVNETASIVFGAKKRGKSAVMIVGGGAPKNFLLQTEPHIQEVLGLNDVGHDYFLQITDARSDTGSLSGATPGEAVSWGKVDPVNLPDAVVCYVDATIALPLLTTYALATHSPRKQSRLFHERQTLYGQLLAAYRKGSGKKDG